MVFWRKKKGDVVIPDNVDASERDQGSASEHSGAPKESDASEPSPIHPDDSLSDDKVSWFKKLRSALHKTNQLLQTDIRDLWKSEGRFVDDDFLRELFAIMVRTDMGQPTATRSAAAG